MIQTSLFSISVFLAEFYPFSPLHILPLMPVYVGFYWFWAWKTVRIFGRDIWYGLVKTLVLSQVYQLVFLIGYGAGGPWPGAYVSWSYLLGGLSSYWESIRWPHQSSATPKTKRVSNWRKDENAMSSSMLSDSHLQFCWPPKNTISFEPELNICLYEWYFSYVVSTTLGLLVCCWPWLSWAPLQHLLNSQAPYGNLENWWCPHHFDGHLAGC